MSADQVGQTGAAARGTETLAAPRASRTLERRSRVLGWLEAYALLVLTLLIGVFFTFFGPTSDTFLTLANLQVLLGNQAVLAIIALAALLPLICDEFDLSVGAEAGLSAVFVASTLSSGTPVLVALLLGIGLGATVGLVNAIMVTRVGVNGVITTLATSTIVSGVMVMKTGGLAVVSNIPTSVTDLGSGNTLGIPRVAWILLVIALGVYYLLEFTPFGRYLYAVGSNPLAARLAGLRTKLLIGATFVVAGVLAGAAGFLQVARSGGADPNSGLNFTLAALAAAFLSASAIKPGRYNAAGTIVAIMFLGVLGNGLSLAGAPAYVESFVNGASLMVGVGLAVYLGRRRSGVAA